MIERKSGVVLLNETDNPDTQVCFKIDGLVNEGFEVRVSNRLPFYGRKLVLPLGK